jgi:hypothetical protein
MLEFAEAKQYGTRWPRAALLSAAFWALLAVVAVGAGQSARAAPNCGTWQGWQYCGESQLYGPPGAYAASWKVQLSGYSYPCVYVSYKIGSTWHPQGDLCQAPYNYFISQGSGSAVCIYAEHWIRDFASLSPKLPTYQCPS